MVQIISPTQPRKQSFSQKLGIGVGRGLEVGNQLRGQHQARENMRQLGLPENTPPDIAKAILVERMKQEGKSNLYQQKQSFLSQILGPKGQSQDKMSGQNAPEMQQGGFNPLDISDADIAQAAAIDPNLGRELRYAKDSALEQKRFNQETERKKEEKERQRFESERSYHTQFSKESGKEIETLRNSIPKKESALNFARNAIETGDLGFFSPDKLADVLGLDVFRTAKGAQLVTAGKENLLSNLSRVSAKGQNLWFEQRLSSMFPKIGQSDEANLTVQEMIEGEVALDKAYLNEYDRIAKEDEKNYGYERKDISKRAHQAIKPLEKHILQRTSYRMKEIEEQEKGLSSLKKEVGKNVSKGTPLTLAMAKLYHDKFGENGLEVAKKNGYHIPTIEEFSSYQKRPEEFREEF